MDLLKCFNNLFETKYDRRKIKSLFGLNAETIILLWAILNEISLIELQIEPIHLLWCLYFLKNYPSCDVSSNYWKVDVKTLRLYICKQNNVDTELNLLWNIYL